jgi:hypothetical protein
MTTPQLLPLTILSHRICALILRILHNRLTVASELDSHSVLLECFHPSAKLTEPPYFCTYRATDGLSDYNTLVETDENLPKRLGDMRNMYSRFRPYRRELEPGGRRVVRPPGDIPGSRTYPGTAQDQYEGESVKQILSLDGHELFTQLVSQSNLVKIGPRNGLFTCFVEVEEGVVRVWRKWLKDMATRDEASTKAVQSEAASLAGKGEETVRDPSVGKLDVADEAILWVSSFKNTGIRFKVRERKLRRDVPLLVRADEEDMPVSYEIEYDGKYPRPSFTFAVLTVIHRAPHPNIPSSSFTREVHGAGRQLFWQGCCLRFVWMMATTYL